MFDSITLQTFDLVQIGLAWLSIFCILAFMAQNWIFQGKFERRLKEIESERERIRQRERLRLKANRADLLADMKSHPLYERIAERFLLLRRAEDDDVALPLRRAGYRGRAPVVAYLALKLLLPPIVFLVAILYLDFVVADSLPLWGTFLVATGFGYVATKFPDIFLKNRQTKRQQQLKKFWPDALDLMLISVESGLSVEMALKTVAREIGFQSFVISEEFLLTLAELSYLQDRKQAFRNFERRVNIEPVGGLVAALTQAERYGTSVAGALRALSRESRDSRMAEAERKAAALPPRMTVPMIIFFLPVLFAIIMTPAILQILATVG